MFAGLQGARDCVARKLREDGIGASVKHTEVTTCSEELQLNAGIMGTHSSSALLNAVFFMNGKVLHLPLPLVQMRLASLLFTRKMAPKITQAVTKIK